METPKIREKIARTVLSQSCSVEEVAQKFGVDEEYVMRCVEELLNSGVVAPEELSNDERREIVGTTTIETFGERDGFNVHLICVCGQPICLPDIDVDTDWNSELDNYADLWLEELLDHLSHPQDAEEEALEIQDPRRVLKVMAEFYDEEPEVQIFGDDSVFKP